MAIDLKNLGDKVQRYRQQLELDIASLSAATGIEPTRMLAIEQGKIEPTGDEVLIFADYFRCDYKFFISNEKVAPFEQTDELYRANPGEFSKEDRRAVQDFLYLCDTECFLMKALGRQFTPFAFNPVGNNFKNQGEQAAKALRNILGYSTQDISVDVYDDFRRVGVHVFRRRLGNSKISGLFVVHPVADQCALVNASEDLYRQRFSAAHEMAHAIFDSNKGVSVSYKHPFGIDLVEVRANRFASCFLMPPELLAKLPNPNQWSDDDAVHYAERLRVSCHALGVALKAADLIDDARMNRMRNLRLSAKVDPELSADLTDKQRDRKRHLLDLGLSDFYVNLCFDALRANKISVGRLCEALLCDHADAVEIASIYGRALYGN
jgi:Zn-dependent peptidase ImmA (M78 family)/transcriptional regulator with XRE-family HTH domain